MSSPQKISVAQLEELIEERELHDSWLLTEESRFTFGEITLVLRSSEYAKRRTHFEFKFSRVLHFGYETCFDGNCWAAELCAHDVDLCDTELTEKWRRRLDMLNDDDVEFNDNTGERLSPEAKVYHVVFDIMYLKSPLDDFAVPMQNGLNILSRGLEVRDLGPKFKRGAK